MIGGGKINGSPHEPVMQEKPLKLTSDVQPAIRGTFGEAWPMEMAEAMARSGLEAQAAELTISSWIVRAPHAHPLWSFYWIGCISLRHMPGHPAPKIFLPGATHEVMVYALNPDEVPAVDDAPSLLAPANFHGQFVEPSDAAAAERIAHTVHDVVNGILNPDTDARSQWMQRFSDSNLRKGIA